MWLLSFLKGDQQMNTELKSFLDIAFEGVTTVEDILKKNYASLIGDLLLAADEVPSIVSHFSDLPAEIEALKGSAQEADLISYIETKFSGISTSKAQVILAAGLKLVTDLVQDGLALKAALSS